MLNIIHNANLLNKEVEATIEEEVGIEIADAVLMSLREDVERVEKMVEEFNKISRTRALKDRFDKASTFAYNMYHLVREAVIYNEWVERGSCAYMVWNRFAERIEYKAKLGISDKTGLIYLGESVYSLEREMNELVDSFKELKKQEEAA